MAHVPVRWSRVVRHLAVPALAAAVIALLPLTPSGRQPATAAWTPMSPVSVTFTDAAPGARTTSAHLLAFNDFHGNIDPPTGSGGLVNGTPAGGVEYLTTWVKRLREQARQQTDNVVTVAAGDLIGATPLVSAAFHDEPTIELMDNLGLDFSSVGNHEFDEGVTELRRMQTGGCHPIDGCQDGDGFAGADFDYLAANVTSKSTGLPIMLPLQIRIFDGVPVAFVGMTLEGTPSIVNPAGIRTVDFRDEVTVANQYADILGFLGIRSMVLLIHEGGAQASPPSPLDPSGCANFAGAITGIVAGLRPAYGVVVSGHTHRSYTCRLPNSGGTSVVTSAGSAGTLVTDITMTFDRRSRRFVSASAYNQIVENGVPDGNGGWVRDGNNFVRSPDLVDASAKVIADKYRRAVAPLANRVVGTVSADIVTTAAASGESPLGDVIADAQLRYTQSAGAQIALMNPGGIRAALTFAGNPTNPAVTGADGEVTYGEAFTVQPFNNLVVTQTLTGAQLKTVLEEQFPGFGGQTSPTARILQVSAGFAVTYDASRAAGDRILSMALNGTPIDPAGTYRVTMNDFLANGGDGFSAFTGGTDRVTAPGFDVDALVAYLATGPVAPGPVNRITRLGA